MSYYIAGSEALTEVWKNGGISKERLIAVSDWLLHQIIFDAGAAVEIWGGERGEMAGLFDASLFFRAIAFTECKPDENAGVPTRQELLVRYLTSRLEPDAKRLQLMARTLRGLLLQATRRARSAKNKLLAGLAFGGLYMAFPQDLQAAIGFNRKELAELYLDQWTPFSFGKYSFDLGEFWRAAERALRRGESSLTTRTPDRIGFRVTTTVDEEQTMIILQAPDGSTRFRVSDPALNLLKTDQTVREASLVTIASGWTSLRR
jgi:hypothetical protein